MAVDLREILAGLQSCASLPVEQQFVNACTEAIGDQTVSEHLRYRHVEGLLRSESAGLLAAPWGCAIPTEIWRALASYAGQTPSPVALVRRALIGGLGLAAVTIEPGRQAWIPAFVVRECERRLGASVPRQGTRWRIPTWWPVPIEQVLVPDLVDETLIAAALPMLGLGMTCSTAIERACYPEAWLTAEVSVGPTRDDLLALMAADPPTGVRALLSGYGGDVLAGAAQCLGVQVMHAAHHAGEAGWQGALLGGCSLGVYGQSVIVAAGWWRSALLGLDCMAFGSQAEDTVPVERFLIERGGGAEVDVGQPLPAFIFPVHLGQGIRRIPVDWSKVAVVS